MSGFVGYMRNGSPGARGATRPVEWYKYGFRNRCSGCSPTGTISLSIVRQPDGSTDIGIYYDFQPIVKIDYTVVRSVCIVFRYVHRLI